VKPSGNYQLNIGAGQNALQDHPRNSFPEFHSSQAIGHLWRRGHHIS
jgi:hypothetical protein